ncbi:UNVERIFIED_CONTAM: hypothetical protein Slati_1268900 [Sesamum latifolium]|uniref:DUF6821 domain-containing protein n=1 Tax=Sesamum latifolium TaxID=2727402 RepID=A0AAW2XG12_9LAMI
MGTSPDSDDDGSLQLHDHGLNTALLHIDYFISPPPQPIHPHQPPPTLQLQDHHPLPIINITPAQASPEINKSFTTSADQHPIPQDKFHQTGFMMRLDSNTTWVIMPQIDSAGVSHFQENGDPCKADPKTQVIKKSKKKLPSELEGGFNIWKWSSNGLGAICSFGVAAATFCLIIFSTHRNKKHTHQNQTLQFQIYNSDKRMKQVIHQASKLNEAGRGVGITTFGGYYDDAAV